MYMLIADGRVRNKVVGEHKSGEESPWDIYNNCVNKADIKVR